MFLIWLLFVDERIHLFQIIIYKHSLYACFKDFKLLFISRSAVVYLFRQLRTGLSRRCCLLIQYNNNSDSVLTYNYMNLICDISLTAFGWGRVKGWALRKFVKMTRLATLSSFSGLTGCGLNSRLLLLVLLRHSRHPDRRFLHIFRQNIQFRYEKRGSQRSLVNEIKIFVERHLVGIS